MRRTLRRPCSIGRWIGPIFDEEPRYASSASAGATRSRRFAQVAAADAALDRAKSRARDRVEIQAMA